jgi:hypothetical protein
MDETETNIDLAEKYLLGELDDETALDFEADVFPDEDLSEHLEVTRHELAEKYLTGELEHSRRQQFETHFLASSYNREILLSTQALLESTAGMPDPARRGFLARIRGLSLWRIAIPAFVSLLLIVGAAFIFLLQNDYLGEDISHFPVPPPTAIPEVRPSESKLPSDTNNNSRNGNEPSDQTERNASNQNQSAQPAPAPQVPTFASILLLPGSRAVGSNEPVLRLKKTDKTVKLELLGPEEDPGQSFARFRLNVEDAGGAEIWSSELSKRENKPNRKMQYQLDAGNFKTGTYIFRITGIPETGAPENVQKTTFKVIRSEN